MRIELDIAVRPSVLKFIASKHSVEPFVVTTENYLGSYLHNCLVRFKGHPRDTYRKLDPKIYSAKLRIALTEDMFRRYGWYIHPRKQYFFNQMVENIMYESFFFYMDLHVNDLGKRQYDSYLSFREYFGLTEDDLTLKTLEKRWERHNKRLIA